MENLNVEFVIWTQLHNESFPGENCHMHIKEEPQFFSSYKDIYDSIPRNCKSLIINKKKFFINNKDWIPKKEREEIEDLEEAIKKEEEENYNLIYSNLEEFKYGKYILKIINFNEILENDEIFIENRNIKNRYYYKYYRPIIYSGKVIEIIKSNSRKTTRSIKTINDNITNSCLNFFLIIK